MNNKQAPVTWLRKLLARQDDRAGSSFASSFWALVAWRPRQTKKVLSCVSDSLAIVCGLVIGKFTGFDHNIDMELIC